MMSHSRVVSYYSPRLYNVHFRVVSLMHIFQLFMQPLSSNLDRATEFQDL